MSEIKNVQENLNLYIYFEIKYNFKDEKINESIETTLKEISNLKLLNFESKLELKSTILENIFPELKTNLSLNFKNYQIRIEKDSIIINFPKEKGYYGQVPRVLSRIFSRPGVKSKKEEEIKPTLKELREIDDLSKLYLINKFFEFKEKIDPQSIEITSMIRPTKEISFEFINNLLNKNTESKKNYKVSNLDIDIEEDENVYSYVFGQETKDIFSLTLLKGKLKWSKSILDLLNENINKLKEIIEEINL